MDSCLRRYFDSLAPSSLDARRGLLEEFFGFCGVGVDESVEWQRQHPGDYRFVDLAYDWFRSRQLMVSSKRTQMSTIRGLFLVNRAPLPVDRHRFRSEKVPVVGELRLEEFRKMLVACRLEYRCAYLMMFQSGSGINELCYVNENFANFVFDEVRKGRDVVCLSMPGRKQKRNVQPYYTFFGGDSVECLRQLFTLRGWRRDGVLFRTEKGIPFSRNCLHRYFQNVAFRLGFVKPKTPCCLGCGGETVKKRVRSGGVDRFGYLCTVCGKINWIDEMSLNKRGLAGVRYRIHTHEIRDLFRTEFHRAQTYAGADPKCAEFFMGHSIDSLNYDKIMRDRTYALSQYRRALPWLNVLSEDPRFIDRCEVEDQLESQRVQAEVMSKKVVELERKLKVLDSPELRRLLKQLEDG